MKHNEKVEQLKSVSLKEPPNPHHHPLATLYSNKHIQPEVSENPEKLIVKHNEKVEQLKSVPLKEPPKPALKLAQREDADDEGWDDFLDDDKPIGGAAKFVPLKLPESNNNNTTTANNNTPFRPTKKRDDGKGMQNPVRLSSFFRSTL